MPNNSITPIINTGRDKINACFRCFEIFSPVLIIGVIELFGIDVHDLIVVLSMLLLIFPTFYLWYYMLVDIFEKNKLHFVFMYL
jgi:uncharacterized membrane protein